MAQRFTIYLNGKRGCNQLISEVQEMNGLNVAVSSHTCRHRTTHVHIIVRFSMRAQSCHSWLTSLECAEAETWLIMGVIPFLFRLHHYISMYRAISLYIYVYVHIQILGLKHVWLFDSLKKKKKQKERGKKYIKQLVYCFCISQFWMGKTSMSSSFLDFLTVRPLSFIFNELTNAFLARKGQIHSF